MRPYNVWVEGYAATGEHGTAQSLGLVYAENFKAACRKALEEQKWDLRYYNEERNTYWGCRMFSSEAEARAAFG